MNYAQNFIFGHSGDGLPIPAYSFGIGGQKILILGGVHGDEIEGVQAAHGLLGAFLKDFSYQLQIVIVPSFNIDGILRGTRKNAHKVDLNRNLPTLDWSPNVAKESYYPGTHACSESENQALVKFIDEFNPKFILSLHSWLPMLNTNGDCKRIAQTISSLTGYRVTDDIGYPTPGSLGTYCGLERHIPTLTYEIERGLSGPEILRTHVPAILEGLKVYER